MDAIIQFITIAGAAAGLAWFVSELFKNQRHDFHGRLKHRDGRLLRIELFLREKLGFDLSSDLPKVDDKD